MALFEKLRISLARGETPPVLVAAGDADEHPSRREFLEAAFSEARTFLHARTGRPIDFVPITIDGDFVSGIFRRAAPVPLHDQSLEVYKAENYEGAVFILSLAKDQTAWMQLNRKLGSTKSILESFFEYLSEKSSISQWDVYVRYFEDEREYFDVIRKRRAEIARITFTFVPPNALSADDEVYNLIKAVHQEAHPDIQQHVYKAVPGQMNPDTEHMNASARIAMTGGGEAVVQDKKQRVLFNSGQARVTRDVPDEELPTPSPAHASFMRRVRDWLFVK